MSFAASAPAEPVQQPNFNPSWMRSAFHGGGVTSSPRVSTNEEEEHPLSAPVFLKNRYGREDLLALMVTDSQPPEGLENCPFFVRSPSQPIVCFPLSELELRLQHNINSSKAMSQLSQAERNSVVAGGPQIGTMTPNSSRGGGNGGWTPVKPSRVGSQNTSLPNGRGGARPFTARGAARVGESPRESLEEPKEGYFNARFGNRGGRGGVAMARGGSTTASTTFNSRAQGLYDPRDPKDRPRNRVRSTSDEAENNGNNENGGWTTVKPTAWKERENTNAWNKEGVSAWNTSREGSQGPWKSESSGTMPEWMDDGDKEESPLVSGQGSFDDQGIYRQAALKQAGNNPTGPAQSQFTERPVVPEPNSWVSNESRKEAVPNTNPNQSFTRPAEDTSHDLMRKYPADTVNPYVASMPIAPVPIVCTPPTFTYLDPTECERGPFEKPQMDAWFKSGYFKDNLKVKRTGDTAYRTLGELKRMNGVLTPFDFKDDINPPPVQGVAAVPPHSYPSFGLFNNSMWNDPAISINPMNSQMNNQMNAQMNAQMNNPMNNQMNNQMNTQMNTQMNYGQPMIDIISERKQQHLEGQRRVLEEQLKMKEQNMLQSLKRQAEEQQRIIAEREYAIKKKEEELERAYEEERARRELEQFELAEKIRQFEKQQKLREEEILRKAEEARKKELLRLAEEKMKKEEEERIRRSEEAAENHRKKLLEKAAEDAAKIRKQQEEARKAEERRAEERRIEERRAQERFAEAQRAALAAAAAAEVMSNVKTYGDDPWETVSKIDNRNHGNDGWTTASSKKVTPAASYKPAWSAAPAVSKTEKSLKEIQEEEERILKREKEEKARQKKEEVAANIQTVGTWSNATQRLSWNQPQLSKAGGSKVAWGGAGTDSQPPTPSSINWDGPTLQAANKIVAAPPKKTAPTKPVPVKTPPAKPIKNNNNEANAFTSWVVTRLKQLSDSVDADVLADFLKTVENPNEVEDYVEGYLGTSKSSKEFVKEFLQKRCEMRNRKTDKDDLSSASVAPATGTSAGKKKKKAGRLVVDGSCLGFRPAADPNRVNQGTIEFVAAPTTTATGRR